MATTQSSRGGGVRLHGRCEKSAASTWRSRWCNAREKLQFCRCLVGLWEKKGEVDEKVVSECAWI